MKESSELIVALYALIERLQKLDPVHQDSVLASIIVADWLRERAAQLPAEVVKTPLEACRDGLEQLSAALRQGPPVHARVTGSLALALEAIAMSMRQAACPHTETREMGRGQLAMLICKRCGQSLPPAAVKRAEGE